MRTTLKHLQYVKFFHLHILVIGAKFFEELNDKVESKNPSLNSRIVVTTSRGRKTHTSPYDSG
jgi:hypothetical protein